MKPIAILAAALAMGACANSTASFGETIHSTDIYLKYSFQDASIFAGAGGAIEVYGAPQDGASAEAVADAIRLPTYLSPSFAKAVEPGLDGHRIAIVFAPKSDLSGESVCKGKAKGNQARSHTKVLAVFCRGETATLSESRLETSNAFVPGQQGFRIGMNRLLREILPLRSPFFQGGRGCRRGGC